MDELNVASYNDRLDEAYDFDEIIDIVNGYGREYGFTDGVICEMWRGQCLYFDTSDTSYDLPWKFGVYRNYNGGGIHWPLTKSQCREEELLPLLDFIYKAMTKIEAMEYDERDDDDWSKSLWTPALADWWRVMY